MPADHSSVQYIVKDGDDIASIAAECGVPAQRIWNHAENEALRKLRKNPSILAPGDVVHVPPREPGAVSVPAGRRHVFVSLTAVVQLRLCLRLDGKPRASQPFAFEPDHGSRVEGTTDDQGKLEILISAHARMATLHISGDTLRLRIGSLDPIGTRAGVVDRLINLGYLGAGDATDEELAQAVTEFQAAHELKATGILNTMTRERIAEEHGC